MYRIRGIQRSPETARMLEDRKSKETDAGARKQLDEIITAITH